MCIYMCITVLYYTYNISVPLTSEMMATPLQPCAECKFHWAKILGGTRAYRTNESNLKDRITNRMVCRLSSMEKKNRICIYITKLSEALCRELHTLSSIAQLMAQWNGATFLFLIFFQS